MNFVLIAIMIGNYLWFPWRTTLLCGFVPCTGLSVTISNKL